MVSPFNIVILSCLVLLPIRLKLPRDHHLHSRRTSVSSWEDYQECDFWTRDTGGGADLEIILKNT